MKMFSSFSKKNIMLSTVAVLSIGFAGCGSSSSSSNTPVTKTGVFADAPVEGLNYKTATQSGLTDAQGHFQYKDGETVEFKLGNLFLGKGKAGAFVTPYIISDNNTTATNIAMVLQNFDGNRSNTQVLNLSQLKDFNFTADDINITATPIVLQSKVNDLLSTGSFQNYVDDTNLTLITETKVKNNMDDYIHQYENGSKTSTGKITKFTKEYLNGKTFYLGDSTDKLKFMISFTDSKMIWTDLNNPDSNNTTSAPYTIDTKGFIYWNDPTDGPERWNLISTTDKGIVVPAETTISEGIDQNKTIVLYYNKEDMEATLITVKNGFGEKSLDGIDFYIPLKNGKIADMKFENGKRKDYIDGTIQKENGVDMITPYKIVNGQTVVDESKLGNGNQISKVIAIGEDTITVKTWNIKDGDNAEKNADTQIRYTSLTAAKNAQSQ